MAMTLTLEELKGKIEARLEAEGFERCDIFVTFTGNSRWIKDGSCKRTETGEVLRSGYKVTRVDGVVLDVVEVYRSNGTETDASYRVMITKWSGHSGLTVHREKIYNRYGDKRIANRLDRAIEAFYKAVG